MKKFILCLNSTIALNMLLKILTQRIESGGKVAKGLVAMELSLKKESKLYSFYLLYRGL